MKAGEETRGLELKVTLEDVPDGKWRMELSLGGSWPGPAVVKVSGPTYRDTLCAALKAMATAVELTE